jgi:hypothetical protein
MAVREPNLAVWLIDSLSSGLVAIDAAGSLTALNEAAQRILGGPGGDAAPRWPSGPSCSGCWRMRWTGASGLRGPSWCSPPMP